MQSKEQAIQDIKVAHQLFECKRYYSLENKKVADVKTLKSARSL